MALFGRLFGKKVPVAKPVNIPTAQKVSRPATGAVLGPFPVAKPVGPPVTIPTAQKVKKPMRVIGRGSPPTGKRDNPLYTVPVEGLTEFLGGEEMGFTSSWIARAEYVVEIQALYVTFLDGHRVQVTPISSLEAQEFFQSSSKGGWYWNFVLGPGYVMGQRWTGRKSVADF